MTAKRCSLVATKNSDDGERSSYFFVDDFCVNGLGGSFEGLLSHGKDERAFACVFLRLVIL